MTQFNLPPGVSAQDLEAPSDPSPEDFWAALDRDNDRYVDRCLAEGKDWRIHAAVQQRTPTDPIQVCTYPARPVNGWRALVHAPSGRMFNRFGQRLTIEREFSASMALLQAVQITVEAGVVEWFDCEALERRHGLGQGTLIVFDYIVPGSHESYLDRKARLAQVRPVHNYTLPPQSKHVYAVSAFAAGNLGDLEFYRSLKQLNRQWHCPFYEGVIAKRADSIYPVQLRSPTLEFAGWVKHRWAG